MELDQESNDKNQSKTYLPEVETYLCLLVLIYLHDKKEYEKVCIIIFFFNLFFFIIFFFPLI